MIDGLPIIVLGAVFGGLAAICSFLISYAEWTHHYTSKKEPIKHSLEMALVTFVFFIILTLLTVVIIRWFR